MTGTKKEKIMNFGDIFNIPNLLEVFENWKDLRLNGADKRLITDQDEKYIVLAGPNGVVLPFVFSKEGIEILYNSGIWRENFESGHVQIYKLENPKVDVFVMNEIPDDIKEMVSNYLDRLKPSSYNR